MKKIIKISYFYYATGLILCLYSFVSQTKQVLNVGDTYYVISGNDFAIFTTLIYLVLGTFFLLIEKHLSLGLKFFPYLTFNIPLVYFIFSDLSVYENPGYYLANPIAYKVNTELIPLVLISSFVLSIMLFLVLFVYSFWKWKKKASI